MLFRTSAAVVLACAAGWCAEPVREIAFETGQFRWPTIPGFHGSRIYFREQGRHSRVAVYTPEAFGNGVREATMELGEPGGAVPEVLTVAIDTDGTLAIGWQSSSGPKPAAGIDFHSPAGKFQRTLDTGAFVPAHLAFAPDHSLWSFGWQRDPTEPRRPDAQDYRTLRRFGTEGQAAALLPRSLFAQEPGVQSWQRRQVAVGGGRVGVLAYPTSRNGKREWVEVDLEGNVAGRWDVPFTVDRTAITADGRVYLESGENSGRIVAQLDRAQGTWIKIAQPPPGILCGAEGNELVFADWVQGQLHLRWYAGL